MKPIDYLRAMTRRKPKYATGGIVNATWRPLNEDGCTLTIDNSADGAMTRPTGHIVFAGAPLTDDQVQQIRNSFQVLGRVRVPELDGAPLFCPCAVIYSRCQDPAKHGPPC